MHDIMTLEEVSEYLRVTERTVSDWAQKGDLPGGKLGTSWRFKRVDVERWVNERLSGGREPVSTSGGMLPEDVLQPGRVLLVRDGVAKPELLRRMVDKLAETGKVEDVEAVWQGVQDREALMSTGIGFGIGVPHVRMDCVSDLVMSMAVCSEGVKGYDSLDGQPVQIVCMLAARTDQHARYLKMLSYISARLKHASIRERILSQGDAEGVCQQLLGGGL